MKSSEEHLIRFLEVRIEKKEKEEREWTHVNTPAPLYGFYAGAAGGLIN